MTSKMKQWVALSLVGVLAVLAAGWFLLVSPKRSEAAGVRTQVASQESKNSGLQAQLAVLKAQAKTLPQQQADLARVAAKIPDNPALPALIRALSSAADEANVELVSISPAPPVAVTAAPGALPSAAGAKPAASTTLTLQSPSGAASGFSPGVLNSIAVTINVVGGYFQVEQFLDRLENLSRAAKVTAFSVAPGQNPVKPKAQDAPVVSENPGKVLSANLTANVYMASGRGSAPAATAPVK